MHDTLFFGALAAMVSAGVSYAFFSGVVIPALHWAGIETMAREAALAWM